MHIIPSKHSLLFLCDAAVKGEFPGYPGVALRAFYVKPDREIEIFTHTARGNMYGLVMAEYAGEKPVYYGESRSYFRRFTNLRNPSYNGVITFVSEAYRLRPNTAILSSRRIADHEGTDALGMTIYICDESHRGWLPVYVAMELPMLEPPSWLELPTEPERVLVGTH